MNKVAMNAIIIINIRKNILWIVAMKTNKITHIKAYFKRFELLLLIPKSVKINSGKRTINKKRVDVVHKLNRINRGDNEKLNATINANKSLL